MTWVNGKFSAILGFMFIGFVRFYKIVFSSVMPGTCRFSPTCSCYALEAFKNHGPWRGSWLSIHRIVRCNPWAKWGFDPVPPVPTQAHTKYNLKVQENP